MAVDRARDRTEELLERAEELSNILALSRGIDYRVNWKALRIVPDAPAFQPGASARSEPPPDLAEYLPPPPNFFQRTIPLLKDSYERKQEEATAQYDAAREAHAQREKERVAKLAKLKDDHEAILARNRHHADEQNRALDELVERYRSGETDGVETMAEIALATDDLPEIESASRAVYDKSSKRLVVERQLPTADIVPAAESVRYVKSSNEFAEKKRSAANIKMIYNRLCAGIVVRTLRAIALGDSAATIETIVVNGYVDTIDPATGHPTRPTLLSVSASAEEVRDLEISNLDPVACLKRFGARISPNSQELEPVKPIIEFNMADPRFIRETDVLGTLDTRPNLAELTPGEFESLMTNLFQKMGLETRQTRASRDGGIDCVAWDTRPVVGGKVVVQAKRYKNTVGVGAVRDLYGAMTNEKAAKGILVTTSGFGRAAYEFAKDKPMELVSGANLLALLAEHANVVAKIEFPDTWADLSAAVES
jgi:restriction system protein